LFALLRLVSARYVARSRGRTLLTLFGIALGVAALVAIDVVNGSSNATIDELVAAYAGRATLSVRAASGTLSGDALSEIGRIEGVRAAAGSIQAALLVGPDARTALPFIAGTGDEAAVRDEPLARGAAPARGEAALGADAARRLGVDVGGSFRALTPSGLRDIRVSGVLADTGLGRANAGLIALVPYPTADDWYRRDGRLDAIDVVTGPGAHVGDVSARIAAALPGADVTTPAARGGQTKKLVASLQSLLQVISALSLFIGTFLVFNTMSIAVAQRKRDFGIVRALGARRRDVVLLVVAEAGILGGAAALAGTAIGVLLARGLLAAVNEQIRASFVAGLADQLVVSGERLAGLALLGVAAAVVGALGPAIAAAAAPPIDAMSAPRYAAVARPLRLRLLAVAAAFAVLAAAGIAAQRVASDPAPASGAALALMLAIAAAASPLLALGMRGAGPLLDRAFGPVARLARDSVLRNPGRAAVTAAALSAAVTMVVGMASFIESDRRTIFDWLDQAVNADFFVSAGPIGANSTPIAMDPSLGDVIARVDGVRAVDRFRHVRVEYEDSFAAIQSVDIPIYLTRGRLLLAPGTAPYDLSRMVGTDELFVSENFARKHGVRQGQTLVLRTPDGPREFRVVAIAVDYTTDQGLIFMDRTTYVRRFHDAAVDAFAVMLAERSREGDVRAALARLEGGALFVQTNAEFKGGIRKIVDDFFSTTYVMEAIALLVGVLGVANTMLVAVLERRREIGVLRAIGATRRQVRATVLIEASTIGACGALLGLAGGAALAAMTLVVSESTTGWVLPYVYEWRTAVSVTVLAVVAALAAGWWPARGAARAEVASALAYE